MAFQHQVKSKMLYFVDRKKNIIRRAGENIAAAEVEACILEHNQVLTVACLAIPDELREEEILACIVLSNKRSRLKRSAENLFKHVFDRLAYFKAPGWILFVDSLPTTGTQKNLKHKIFADNEDPRKRKDIFDLRVLKMRKNHNPTIK